MNIIKSNEIHSLLIQIQDHLMPILDSYEQMLYHYLFRHTYLSGRSQTTIGIRSLQTQIGLGIGKAGSHPSQHIISDKLRSLKKKGCVKIHHRGMNGTTVEVFLPKDVPGLIPAIQITTEQNIDLLDFFNTPELRPLILNREQHTCFYCLRKIDEASFTLDHVDPRCSGNEDNSYRNIVACCFECNSRKQGNRATDFLKKLYREELLSTDEYKERIEKIHLLKDGKLRPKLT